MPTYNNYKQYVFKIWFQTTVPSHIGYKHVQHLKDNNVDTVSPLGLLTQYI
jgi:hypothetical protein